MNNEKLEAGLASDLNRELEALTISDELPKPRTFKRELVFYPPETTPEYANEYGYILLLEVNDSDSKFNGAEEMMTALWIDKEWWVIQQDYEIPDKENYEDKWSSQVFQPLLFEKFEEGYFKLIGWAVIYGGSKPKL